MCPIKNVFVTRKIVENGLNILHDNQISIDEYQNLDGKNDLSIPKEELYLRAKKADAMVTMLSDKIDREFLEENSHLKLIANYAVGFNNIDLECCKRLGIIVTNTPDAVTRPTVEVTIGLILNITRNFPKAHQTLMQENFRGFDPKGFLGTSLYGKTVGIIGMGRIGTEVARILSQAFNCRILYTSMKSTASFGEKVTLEELLKTADIISLHCPLNSETRHLINQKNIGLMKEDSFLVNTSRGEVIEQDALYQALKNNKIKAAGLDVTTPEPLPKSHPLLSLDNVYLLPHIGSASNEARLEMAKICALNILDYNQGLKARNTVV